MPPGPQAAEPAAAPRFDTVDILRGLSVLAVVLLHVSNYLGFGGYPIGAAWPKALRYLVFSNGGNGVSIFFAVSGFLITWTIALGCLCALLTNRCAAATPSHARRGSLC